MKQIFRLFKKLKANNVGIITIKELSKTFPFLEDA